MAVDSKQYASNWDSVVVYPDTQTVSFSTAGCGCCSDGKTLPLGPEALPLLREHAEDLRQELQDIERLIMELS